MADDISSRIITLGEDSITIIGHFNDPNSVFTHSYQNSDTRELDNLFGMDGERFPADDPRRHSLVRCVGMGSLGASEVESTLRYFVGIALLAGNFIGLRETELRAQAAKNPKCVAMVDIDESLRHRDMCRDPYLVRKNVEGYDVLFPRGIRRSYR